MLILPFIQKYTRMPAMIMLILYASNIRAQEVLISAGLDTSSALIGDQLRLQLHVEKPADFIVEFPSLKDTITRSIEITGDSYSDTAILPGNRMSYDRELVITVFDTGFFEIPALPFISRKGHLHDTITTPPVIFEIRAVKADSTLRDIKANYKAPLSMGEIWAYVKEYYPYGLASIVAGLLIWRLVRHIRKRLGKSTAGVREAEPELPEIIALRELERLKAEKPWAHHRIKAYHIRLSEILRSYIEGRFQIKALEQTTEEILHDLKSSDCRSPDHNRLAGILRLADLVKFAKVIPDEEENAAQVDLAAEFVQSTSPVREMPLQGDKQQESILQDKSIPENV